MILSAHQPAYLPWLGYFDKLIRSDVFVYLDTVQFEKNSFTNRNKIKTAQGPLWLTIPVKLKGHINSTLLGTSIDNTQDWKKKHLRSIFMAYKKSLRFEECFTKLEQLYEIHHDSLADLCFDHLSFWLKELGINKKIVRSSDLTIDSKKSYLILDLCKHFKADHYLSGALGKQYLEEYKFAEHGISIEYQDFKHPVYPQIHGEFVPQLAVIDYWMNTNNSSCFWEDK